MTLTQPTADTLITLHTEVKNILRLPFYLNKLVCFCFHFCHDFWAMSKKIFLSTQVPSLTGDFSKGVLQLFPRVSWTPTPMIQWIWFKFSLFSFFFLNNLLFLFHKSFPQNTLYFHLSFKVALIFTFTCIFSFLTYTIYRRFISISVLLSLQHKAYLDNDSKIIRWTLHYLLRQGWWAVVPTGKMHPLVVRRS